MTFKEAAEFRLPFGKHRGESLDSIASDDDGLRYLDWLVGQELYGAAKEAVETYLGDPSIKKELSTL